MTIWTDTLEPIDLMECASAVNREFPGCALFVTVGGRSDRARVRAKRFDKVRLGSNYSRRWPNSGVHGADTLRFSEDSPTSWSGAASWTEWGWWLARVFERDPNARCGDYDGLNDFHEQTNGRFKDPRTPRERQIKRAGATL